MQDSLLTELRRAQNFSKAKLLVRLANDISKWESLLLIYYLEVNEGTIGITEVYESLKNKTKSKLNLTNFLRDCVSDGYLYTEKKGRRKILKLSSQLKAEIDYFFNLNAVGDYSENVELQKNFSKNF